MIELPKDDRQQAIASIERYFRENMEEPIGNVAASGLLGFFLEEIGPAIYNQAVQDVQERLRTRIDELDLEVHEDGFQYWRKFEKSPRRMWARAHGRGRREPRQVVIAAAAPAACTKLGALRTEHRT